MKDISVIDSNINTSRSKKSTRRSSKKFQTLPKKDTVVSLVSIEMERKPIKRRKIKNGVFSYGCERNDNPNPSHVLNTLNSGNPTPKNLILGGDITSSIRTIDKVGGEDGEEAPRK